MSVRILIMVPDMLKLSVGKLRRIIREELKILAVKDKSPIEGLGLFAGQFVPSGRIISKWSDGFDMTYSKDYPDTLPEEEGEIFKRYASFDGETWSLAGDDAAYFNHADDPNVTVIPDERRPAHWDRIAARDIMPGEELTMDYSEIGFDTVE